jgi:hypothetical protein
MRLVNIVQNRDTGLWEVSVYAWGDAMRRPFNSVIEWVTFCGPINPSGLTRTVTVDAAREDYGCRFTLDKERTK